LCGENLSTDLPSGKFFFKIEKMAVGLGRIFARGDREKILIFYYIVILFSKKPILFPKIEKIGF
jgi:hypothetical protein